jgi:L-fuconolactonase
LEGALIVAASSATTGQAPLLDCHVHLWNESDSEFIPLLRKIGALRHDFTLDQLERHQQLAGVGASILVQPDHSLERAYHWLSVADTTDVLCGVVCSFDIAREDAVEVIPDFRKSGKFRGVRAAAPNMFGQAEWISDPRTSQGLRLFEQLNCNVELLLQVEALPAAAKTLAAFDGSNLCINHGGRPAPISGLIEPWATDLRQLARQSRAHVKLSNLAERGGIEWTVQSLRPYVATIVEAFGSSRVMFGSNWPVLELSATYQGWIDAVLEILESLGLSQDEQDDIMWRTASKFYSIDWPRKQ